MARSVAEHIGAIISTSLIATAATTPFAIYHFQSFSFYGFAANTLAIPITSFWVMPCILMAYILAPFGCDGWFIDAAGAGIGITIKIAETVAHWPYAITYLPAMPWPALAIITFGGLWLCIWRRRWRWLGLLPVLIGMLYPLTTPSPNVMVSPDAKDWAVRLDDGRLAVSNLDHDAFVYTQWQQRLGNPPLVDSSAMTAADSQLRCDEMGCVYRLGESRIAFPAVELAALEDCGQSNAVVSEVIVRACAAPHILDEPEFWNHGSHVLYREGDGLRVDYSRPGRAMRPWSPGWDYQHRPRSFSESMEQE